MNLYFVVEGRRTERKIYPEWIRHALPFMKQVQAPEKADVDSFYLMSGGGYPSILGHAEKAIETINSLDGGYDYLVVVVDSEEGTAAERELEFQNLLRRKPLSRSGMKVIVQHRCIETWLLGNRRIATKQPNAAEHIACLDFYDVADADPELMNKPRVYSGTTAQYHAHYLKQIFFHRGLTYAKERPGDAAKEYYWNELRGRYRETGHLQSFGVFCRFLEEMKALHR